MNLDIFGVLGYLDEGNLELHQGLSEDPELLTELRKNISWLIPQWMTGSSNEKTHRELVIAFDDLCNPGWGAFYRHPELQTKLLALIGPGKKIRHKFFKPRYSRKKTIDSISDLLQEEYPDIRSNEIALWCRDASKTDLIELLDRYGIPLDKRDTFHKQLKAIKS